MLTVLLCCCVAVCALPVGYVSVDTPFRALGPHFHVAMYVLSLAALLQGMLLASFNFGRAPNKFFRVRVGAFVAPGSVPSPARRRLNSKSPRWPRARAHRHPAARRRAATISNLDNRIHFYSYVRSILAKTVDLPIWGVELAYPPHGSCCTHASPQARVNRGRR